MAEVIASNDTKQYIVVKIGIEQYGIDIQYVDNIVRVQRVTRVPKAQNYFIGIINLRGEIIPVMSARVRFDLPTDEITNASRIIIIKMDVHSAIGILVDEVNEVVTLDENSVEAVATDKLDGKAIYLNGIGKHGDGLISLLNIANVISDKEHA